MKYIWADGSLSSGFRFYGPFVTIDEAVAEIKSRQPLVGPGCVLELIPVEQHPVRPFAVADEAEAAKEDGE
jgi:hypothetical protein